MPEGLAEFPGRLLLAFANLAAVDRHIVLEPPAGNLDVPKATSTNRIPSSRSTGRVPHGSLPSVNAA